MDSFEFNKIAGAVLGSVIFIFVIRLVAEHIYEPEMPEKPGYAVQGVEEAKPGAAAAVVVAEAMPDWGTALPAADVAAGKTISARCEQCHDLSSAKTNKIGPELFAVVDRARASVAGFDYSSAMKGKPGNWTYDELFKFIKSPGSDIPGTKMSFAGLSRSQDRINLIAYLRTNAEAPAAIPAPKPAEAAAPAAAAPAAEGAAAPAAAAPAAPAAAPAAAAH